MRIGVHVVEHVCRRIAIQINRSYRVALARSFRVSARVLTRADAQSMRAHAHTGGSSSICFCIICSISMRIRIVTCMYRCMYRCIRRCPCRCMCRFPSVCIYLCGCASACACSSDWCNAFPSACAWRQLDAQLHGYLSVRTCAVVHVHVHVHAHHLVARGLHLRARVSRNGARA
jgi:hypothetical protein